ncbi:MAG TPA: DUF4157 domain-containing protein [Thermoanaerobaculia bacterium]|nr:DUF4157 domain-containing protein [Thermoanaerobaculia bacterium]
MRHPEQAATAGAHQPPTPAGLLRRCGCGQHSGGGECAECRKKRLGRSLERSAVSAEAPEVAPASVHQTLVAGGQPLDGATRSHFERGFGRDFSRVRVHSDAGAAQSAREVSARAYTVGHHVAFGAGQYQPRSAEGRRLLGHELAHVAQQDGAPASGEIRIGRADSPAEREAESAAGALERGRPATLARSASELARMPEDEEPVAEAAQDVDQLALEAAQDEGEVLDGDSEVILSGVPEAEGAAGEGAAEPSAISLGVAGLNLPLFALAGDPEVDAAGAGSKAKPAAKDPPKDESKGKETAGKGGGDKDKAPAKKPPPPKITKIEIDLSGQKMTLTWDNGTTEGPFNVSTGKGRPDTKDDPCKTQGEKNCTPAGNFKVGTLGDAKTANSNGDAMAWFVELTGDPVINGRGIGIHNSQSVVTGSVASHGCVRVGKGAAAEAFAKKINRNVMPGKTDVVITGKAPTSAYESAAGRAKRLAAEKKKKDDEAKKKAAQDKAGSKPPPKKDSKPPAKKGKK